jgi:NAD(P)-dependent dehydrogenase (short-subunit alcohol dehydrogenase family)
MRLEDTTVIITGAGAGIGNETAISCAEEGADVIVTDVDEDGGRETVVSIADTPGQAEFRHLDVRDGKAFKTLVNDVADTGFDAIVNNAGIGHPTANVEEIDTETFDRVLDINVRGVWNGCQAALPHMKESGGGSIVNVASLAGLIGLRQQGAYSLSKGAVLNFTRTIAAEAGPAGVRANAVCPAFTNTALAEPYFELLGDGDPELGRERMVRTYPLRRLAEPAEIADCIRFLISDESSFVTGHEFVIDGGYSIA